MAVATGASAAAAASGVTFIRGARSSAAPSNPGVVFLGGADDSACINRDCDSRKAGGTFEVVDPGDGDTCTSRGTKQSNGGSLQHDHAFAKGHQEQAGDEQRETDAARTFLELAREHYGGARGGSLSIGVDYESRCRGHARASETNKLKLAQKALKDSAKAKVAHLHPRSRDDVRTKNDVDELRQSTRDAAQRLRAMSDEATAVVAAAASSAVATLVGYAAAESVSAIARAVAAADDETDSDDSDERRPSKRARLLPSPTDIIDAAELQMNMYVMSEARKSRQAQAQHKQALKEQMQRETVQITTTDGERLTLADQDVRNAVAQLAQRELFGSSAAAAAVSSPAAAAAASSSSAAAADSDLSDEARQRRVTDSLRRNRMVQDTLYPRVDALFEWVYVNCILSDWTSSAPRALPPSVSRDYRVHDAHVSWFNRTLQFVVQYKSLLRDQSHKQMRNVELFAMHALIVASWQTANPLTWGTMQTALETYLDSVNENAWQQQRDEAMRRYQSALVAAVRDPSLPLPVLPDAGSPGKAKPLGRQSSLERTLYTFATALGVKGDWAALVRRLAVWYLIQMQQRVYEQEVGEAVDKCVAVYQKHIRGLKQHDELQCQIGLLSPSSPYSSSSAAASAAASAADSDSDEKSPADAKFMWQFSSAVAAAACVRKVMGNKYLKFNEDEAVNCVVKTFKPSWAKKRQRPSVTKGGQPSMLIKASRFAQIAGVSERQVTACMHLF